MVSSLFSFIWNRPWILLVVSIALASFTGQKLFRMAQINGWVPGAETLEVVVVDKSITESVLSRGRRNTAYWLRWNQGRVNVERETWEGVQIGDKMELSKMLDTGELFLKNGSLYASRGNFVFDIVLLILELFLFVSSLTRLFIKLKQPRAPRTTSRHE